MSIAYPPEDIEFSPAYTATINPPPAGIFIGSDNRFEGTFNSYVT
jgi:hypothetical protein